MRASGGCSMQQSLTAEAASIVKQAINLARRRGHAQVTPIHVANVMLVSPAGLFQRACLKSHTHPLQYKALELCFNVALNRLPTTTPSPILGPQHSLYPSFSNALVAAFKRAQAHQRRGSIENQQQPILALKIETEQLVISILDDPSVSRVMREAGFSSTHVKANVEQTVSLEITSQNNTSPLSSQYSKEPISPLLIPSIILQSSAPIPLHQYEFTPTKQPFLSNQAVRNEDVSGVISSLITTRKKINTVVVGECVGTCESVVRVVKEKIERGDVPNELRHVQFLSLPLLSIKNYSREEIEMKIGELRCLLKGSLGRSVVLYLGDLKPVSEYWGFFGEQRRSFYCPVEHMVMGIRRLLYENSIETVGRLRLLGIANFNSYIKCKAGHPSLETLLDLHPLAIPVGSLDFSLNLDSALQGEKKSIVLGESYSWSLLGNRRDMHLTCCSDCSTNFHREARQLATTVRNMESTTTTTTTSTASGLPSWLQKCKEESREESMSDQMDQAQMKELCRKWNSFCSSIHKTINFTSASPSPTTSISSYDQKSLHNFHATKLGWSAMFESKWPSKEQNFLMCDQNDPPKPDLLSNPNSTPNSASSSETTDPIMEKIMDFKEYTAEYVEAMCSALEKRVPWQKEIIPDIARTVLKCRAGLMRRKEKYNCSDVQEKHETWLFFSGADDDGKVKVAKELAKLIFGSHMSFKSIGLSSFSSPTKADSTDDSRNKRARDECDQGYLERFAKEVRDDPHRVFYVEDVEQVDHFSQKGIKRAVESGKITLPDGEMVLLKDAIVVFSCESFSSTSRASSPPIKRKLHHNNSNNQESEKENDNEDDPEETSSPCVPLDLNLSIDEDAEYTVAEIGILQSVDRKILFKVRVL